LPEKFRDAFSHSYLVQPISSYSDLIRDKDDLNPQEEWPSDALVYFGSKIYADMNCMGAWKVIPRNSLAAVIDTVRNRILSFVLEIESEAPDAGEAAISSPPIAQEKVNQVFNTFITGNVENLSSGGSHYRQIASNEIVSGSFDSLLKYLSLYNIPSEDLTILENAVREDERSHPSPKSIGPKVSEWMGKMLNKAGNGIWKVGVDVASAVITRAVTAYYGLS
jgi:AbiTii